MMALGLRLARRLADDQDGAGGLADEFLGGADHEDFREATVAGAADDEEVGVVVAGGGDDLGGGVTFADDELGPGGAG